MQVTRVLALISAHRRLSGLVVALVLCFVVGFAAGRRTAKPAPQVVHDVQTQIQYKDRIVTVEKPVDRWRDRVVTKYIYAPDGGVVEKVVAETKSGEHQGEVTRTETASGQEKVKDDLRVTPAPAPRWSFYAEAGPWLDLKTGHLEPLGGTIGVTYTVVGPLYLGAVGVEPSILKPVPPVVQVVLGLHGSI